MDRRRFLAAIPALAALAHLPRFAFADRINPNPVATGNAEFAFGLYSQLKSKPGDLFCSPFSISTALAMTSRGAAGDTLSEMSKVLHLPLEGDEVHADFAKLVKSLTTEAGKGAPELLIANALWASSKFAWKEDFLKVVTEQYAAALKSVNFGDPEAARKEINAWVEAQTKGKVRDLFAPGIIDTMTRLVLTNAIYFKGAWKTVFEKHATRDEAFYSNGGTAKQVPMMHQTTRLPYAESDDWQAVELPYRGSDLAMLIVLPKAPDGLAALEGKMNAESMTKWTSELKGIQVALSLPRFKSESEFKLNDTLEAMGMPNAFSKNSDFSRMSAGAALYIQAVVHKAVVEVNEEGTEAAAATGVAVGVARSAPPREPKVFKADHPFMYFIRDSKNGALLFMGRLTEPKS